MTIFTCVVQYLNEGTDQIPTPALATAISNLGKSGWRLMFKPERIAVDGNDGNQKTDSNGNLIWAWVCYFEATS